MERLLYFINKLWVFITTIHPLIYLIIFIISGFFFYVAKQTIQKYRPQTKGINIVATGLVFFVGLPVLGLILCLIVWVYLKDQQF